MGGQKNLALGDRVRFTGIVKKDSREGWHRFVSYIDAPLPGFTGYEWADGKNGITNNTVDSGVIVGKRKYVPMGNDDGIWIPCGDYFTGYLVAYHLARNPVIVRVDQITEINGEPA